jgi:hypothetical protein
MSVSAPSIGDPGDRKVVLARILARAEAARLGIEPSEDDVRGMVHWFRNTHHLQELERFAAWLRHAGLELPRFMAAMRNFATYTKVLQYYAAEIDREVPLHLAMHTVHAFVREQKP